VTVNSEDIGFAEMELSQMSLQRGINLRALAEKMGQCSGAEVRGICTEAGKMLPFIEF
jgi:ATP-dependent 26S proteasome regulatory subunit